MGEILRISWLMRMDRVRFQARESFSSMAFLRPIFQKDFENDAWLQWVRSGKQN